MFQGAVGPSLRHSRKGFVSNGGAVIKEAHNDITIEQLIANVKEEKSMKKWEKSSLEKGFGKINFNEKNRIV